MRPAPRTPSAHPRRNPCHGDAGVTPSRVRRLLCAVALVLTLTALAASRPAPTTAQAADEIVLELPLYTRFVGVRTDRMGRPTVRVHGPDGTLRVEVEAAGPRPSDGHWTIDLSPDAAPGEAVLLAPGDRVAVVVGQAEAEVTLPAMRATADAAADVVRGGGLPAGVAFVQLASDPAWHGAVAPPEPVPVARRPDGGFEVSLGDTFDLRPGTFGQLVAVGSEGHVYAVSFAVPSVTLYADRGYALVRADPAVTLGLEFRSDLDATLFRAGTPLRLGTPDGLRVALLYHDGDVAGGRFEPQPGDRLVLTVDGAVAVDATVPVVTATVDPDPGTVRGRAPGGARVRVRLFDSEPGDRAIEEAVVTAASDGRFAAALPAAATLGADALAEVLAYPGGRAAFTVPGRVPRQTVTLYGNTLSGVIAGWGAVVVEHRNPAGASVARARVQAGPAGEIEAALNDTTGAASVLAPGHRLVITPEIGSPLTLEVPPLTARVDAGRRVLRGTAPPDVPLTVRAYPREPEYFDRQLFDDQYLTLHGRSGPDGDYAIGCEIEDCALRYGVTTAAVGAARYELPWVDRPLVGIGVSVANVFGRATAGLPVTVEALDDDGAVLERWSDQVLPAAAGGLPQWTTDLGRRWPDRLPVGARLRVAVEATTYTVTVPEFGWQADVRADRVSGTGPRGRPVLVVALPRDPDEMRGYGIAQALIGPDGQWAVAFEGFDLMAGDDLELYIGLEGAYLWWSERGVPGPTVPTATPPPTGGRVLLPLVRR